MPTDLGKAIALVARLGGHRNQKNSPAGYQILREGYISLQKICFGYELSDA